MQPSQPQPTKPVMDITVPVASATVPVQKAPDSNERSHSAPTGVSVQLKDVNEKTLRPGPQQPTPPSLPVGTIIVTILVMALLSAMAIMIYFQSNA